MPNMPISQGWLVLDLVKIVRTSDTQLVLR